MMQRQFLQHHLKVLCHQARPVFFIVKMKQVHDCQGVAGSIRQISNIVYYGSSLAGQLSWLERRNHNPQVGGSNPSPATKFSPVFRASFLLQKKPNNQTSNVGTVLVQLVRLVLFKTAKKEQGFANPPIYTVAPVFQIDGVGLDFI